MTSDFHSLAGIPLEQTKNLHCPPISCYDHRFGKSDLTPPAPKKNCHGQENELSSYRVVERVVQDFGWTHRKSDEFRTETRKKSLWRDGVCWKRRRMLGFFQVTRQKNLFFSLWNGAHPLSVRDLPGREEFWPLMWKCFWREKWRKRRKGQFLAPFP